METTGKIISAGLITGAIFTLFLYSPVASPELYRTNNLSNVMARPGVSFEKEMIKPPLVARSKLIKTSDHQLTNLFAEKRNLLNKTTEDTFDPFGQNVGNAEDLYSTSRSLEQNSSKGFALSAAKTIASAGHGAGRVSEARSYGFLALRTDQNAIGSTPQSGTSAEKDEITNPGDNPTGNVLPVSDGLGLLLLMAMGFTWWKKNVLKKKGKNN